jgi:hypothetical protein
VFLSITFKLYYPDTSPFLVYLIGSNTGNSNILELDRRWRSIYGPEFCVEWPSQLGLLVHPKTSEELMNPYRRGIGTCLANKTFSFFFFQGKFIYKRLWSPSHIRGTVIILRSGQISSHLSILIINKTVTILYPDVPVYLLVI